MMYDVSVKHSVSQCPSFFSIINSLLAHKTENWSVALSQGCTMKSNVVVHCGMFIYNTIFPVPATGS